jgi:hypothetical protein
MNISTVIVIALATVFYRIGEHEYRKGWPSAVASIFLSLLGGYFFGTLGILGAGVLLFFGLTVYNILRPPGSTSGF